MIITTAIAPRLVVAHHTVGPGAARGAAIAGPGTAGPAGSLAAVALWRKQQAQG